MQILSVEACSIIEKLPEKCHAIRFILRFIVSVGYIFFCLKAGRDLTHIRQFLPIVYRINYCNI